MKNIYVVWDIYDCNSINRYRQDERDVCVFGSIWFNVYIMFFYDMIKLLRLDKFGNNKKIFWRWNSFFCVK